MEFFKGTIQDVGHTFGSGLASVLLTDGTLLHCDAGPLFGSLNAAFGGDYEGQEIVYSTDFLGCMEGLTPASQWGYGGYTAADIDPEAGLVVEDTPEDGDDADDTEAEDYR